MSLRPDHQQFCLSESLNDFTPAVLTNLPATGIPPTAATSTARCFPAGASRRQLLFTMDPPTAARMLRIGPTASLRAWKPGHSARRSADCHLHDLLLHRQRGQYRRRFVGVAFAELHHDQPSRRRKWPTPRPRPSAPAWRPSTGRFFRRAAPPSGHRYSITGQTMAGPTPRRGQTVFPSVRRAGRLRKRSGRLRPTRLIISRPRRRTVAGAVWAAPSQTFTTPPESGFHLDRGPDLSQRQHAHGQ